MKRVQLVVTGRCEELALHLSLAQLFPDAEWPAAIRVESFTSTPLVGAPPAGVKRTLDKFADKLIGIVDQSGPETMVVGVDDLELHGVAEPAAAAVGDAVLNSLNGSGWASSEQRRRRLKAEVAGRCSFHLLVPMVESYFFGDQAALKRAGAKGVSLFDPSTCDLEDFKVVDAGFTDALDGAHKDDWCRGGIERARHPKRYLKFLSGDRTPGNWSYRESKEGAAALRSLDWSLVLGTPEWTRAARALIDDVADFTESETPAGVLHEVTARTTHRVVRTLRNL